MTYLKYRSLEGLHPEHQRRILASIESEANDTNRIAVKITRILMGGKGSLLQSKIPHITPYDKITDQHIIRLFPDLEPKIIYQHIKSITDIINFSKRLSSPSLSFQESYDRIVWFMNSGGIPNITTMSIFLRKAPTATQAKGVMQDIRKMELSPDIFTINIYLDILLHTDTEYIFDPNDLKEAIQFIGNHYARLDQINRNIIIATFTKTKHREALVTHFSEILESIVI